MNESCHLHEKLTKLEMEIARIKEDPKIASLVFEHNVNLRNRIKALEQETQRYRESLLIQIVMRLISRKNTIINSIKNLWKKTCKTK